jgi:hypothetical protein
MIREMQTDGANGRVMRVVFTRSDVENAIAEAGGTPDEETALRFIDASQRTFHDIEERMIEHGNEALALAVGQWLEKKPCR